MVYEENLSHERNYLLLALRTQIRWIINAIFFNKQDSVVLEYVNQ